MTAFVQTLARSRWRIAATFDGAFANWTVAATYTITRADGSPTTEHVASAFTSDTTTVELALSEALLDGIVYVVAAVGVTGTSATVIQPVSAPTVQHAAADDPASEAFGIDLDWLAASLDASGDTPTVSGRACLVHDLAAIAMTQRGELFHRPDAGAGLPLQVNGPAAAGDLAAAVKREWQRDDRVRSVDRARGTIATDGSVTIDGAVTPIAIDDPIPMSVSRG